MTLQERDKKVTWHPYTQMKLSPDSIGVKTAKGVYLVAENGEQYIDAISSWWVNLHGHSHPHIAKKISEQLNTLEHVIFAGFTHEPAVALAERLLPILPGNMTRVFYSDNGSTAIEVALKMAHQYHQNKNEKNKTKVIALDGAYHGDTFGAMSVSARNVFTEPFNSMLFDVDFIPFPSEGKEQETLAALKKLLQTGDTSCFIVEPLLQGCAGMRTYSADILEKMFLLCKQYDTLVVADEVLTGFGRTGTLFACYQLKNAQPDIICLSKGLTGGTLPMGVTACTQEIFDAFLSDDAHKTLFHGHSFTANPIGCVAGLASLDLLLSADCQKDIQRIAMKHTMQIERFASYTNVKDVRHCGTILAVEIDTGAATDYLSEGRDYFYNFFIERKILMRPLGNIIYLLPPYCITDKELDLIYNAMEELLQNLQNG